MATTDVATELVKQMLAESKASIKVEIEDYRSKRRYFVQVRDMTTVDIVETRSVLYPAATNTCNCCGK